MSWLSELLKSQAKQAKGVAVSEVESAFDRYEAKRMKRDLENLVATLKANGVPEEYIEKVVLVIPRFLDDFEEWVIERITRL